MTLSFLVIIGDFDRRRTSGCPDKADAPLIVNSDAVLPIACSVQLFEVVAGWNSKVTEGLGGVKNQELAVCSSLKVSAELADVSAFPHGVGSSVRERLDHGESITRCVTNGQTRVVRLWS